MRPQLTLKNIRASIFLPFKAYDYDIFTKLQAVIPGGIPYTSSPQHPLFVEDSIFEPGSWAMLSPFKDAMIVVQPQKIDYIRTANIKLPNDNTFWSDFCVSALKAFSFFISEMRCEASRIAVAPSYSFDGDGEQWSTFVRGIFREKTFRGEKFENGECSQTFYIKEAIAGSTIRMNFYSKIYPANQIVLKDGMPLLTNLFNIDLDINTSPDCGYSFNQSSVSAFFDNAMTFSNDFLSYYID